MAIFRISPSTSRFAVNTAAFYDDTAGPDTLIVDPGSFLTATGPAGYGAWLRNTGAWSVTVNGYIYSRQQTGLVLEYGNPAVSTITVGTEGEIGGVTGIGLSSSAIIYNYGVITGSDYGIYLSTPSADTNRIVNAGSISGGLYSIFDYSGSSDIVNNSGWINGLMSLGEGNDRLRNSGLISRVDLGNGNNVLTNTGTIQTSVIAGSGNDALTNSGSIVFGILLRDGSNTLTNTGTIGTDILGGLDVDRVTNGGTIGGGVFLNAGNDVFTNYAIVGEVVNQGVVRGQIDLGAGDDFFDGGAHSERVIDGPGSDTVYLRWGDDVYIATGGTSADGTDAIYAGNGTDTYDAGTTTNPLSVNLDTIAHVSPASLLETAPNAAYGLGVFQDRIYGFENATGGTGNDTIFGSAAANTLDGGAGHDLLFAFGGNDVVRGGAGADWLSGGGGRDLLTGGPDGDKFFFAAASHTGTTALTRDVIMDFEDGIDRIDLQHIDANSLADGDQAFTFIGTNVLFGGVAGQLRAYWTPNGQMVEGDVNGDRNADFSISLVDSGQTIVLDSGDFYL